MGCFSSLWIALDNLQRTLGGAPEVSSVPKLTLAGEFSLATGIPATGPSRIDEGGFSIAAGSADLSVRFAVTFELPATPPPGVPEGSANASLTFPDGTVRTFVWDASGEHHHTDATPAPGPYLAHFEATGNGRYEIHAQVVEGTR